MHTNKKPLMRLCFSFTMVSVFVLAVVFASLATVSAASPKGSTFSPQIVVKQPNGVKPNTGVVPNTGTPTPTPCDAITTSCSAGISTPLTGSLAVSVGTGTATPPTALNGSGSQTITFSFPSYVSDTTGTDGWTLSASSAGLNVPSVGGPTFDAFTINGVTAACTTSASCSGAGNVTPGTGAIPALGTTIDYATVPSSTGDYGSTIVTTSGYVALGATTLGGSASGTIIVTAAPAV